MKTLMRRNSTCVWKRQKASRVPQRPCKRLFQSFIMVLFSTWYKHIVVFTWRVPLLCITTKWVSSQGQEDALWWECQLSTSPPFKSTYILTGPSSCLGKEAQGKVGGHSSIPTSAWAWIGLSHGGNHLLSPTHFQSHCCSLSHTHESEAGSPLLAGRTLGPGDRGRSDLASGGCWLFSPSSATCLLAPAIHSWPFPCLFLILLLILT